MIQLALRSSTQAEPDAGSARSEMIEGRATAVTMSSRPARKTPAPRTPRRTSAERRSISGIRSIFGECSVGGGVDRFVADMTAAVAAWSGALDVDLDDPLDPVEAAMIGQDEAAGSTVRDGQG